MTARQPTRPFDEIFPPPVDVEVWTSRATIYATYRGIGPDTPVVAHAEVRAYEAFEQRAGDPVSDRTGLRTYCNYYWVLVRVGQDLGWIPAVYLKGGPDNHPQPRVRPALPDYWEWH
jgi:hypothetical protein